MPVSNTVALWHFNEGNGDTAYDASGNGYHGFLRSGVEWRDGMYEKAIFGDNYFEFVEIQKPISLLANVDNFKLDPALLTPPTGASGTA